MKIYLSIIPVFVITISKIKEIYIEQCNDSDNVY